MSQWRIHHVSLPARQVRETAQFYADVLEMEETEPPFKPDKSGIFPVDRDHIAWFPDADGRQLHLSQTSQNFAYLNKMHFDPVRNGHVAIEVEDLDRVRARLTERGIYFANSGNWALTGLDQIYVLDPALNAVEINQRMR